MNSDISPNTPQPEVASFMVFNEGQIEPTHNKRIKTLILKTDHFIVYLDDELSVQWSTINVQDGDFASDFGAVTNRESYLEEIAKGLLSPSQHKSYQRLLAESIARLLDDRDSANAKEILDKAESFLKARSTERARRWFIAAAAASTCVALLSILLLWIFRDGVSSRIGITAFEVAIATGTGSLGALISVVLRLHKLNVDAFAGKGVHYFEGVMRVLGGMAGALLVGLAIKSGLILGTINSSEKSLTLLLAVSIVAGASERIVPNLIKQVEGTMFKSDPDPGEA
jgi:hypothetical protein